MAFKFEQPPERLTWYHLGQLLLAEAGTLTYDHEHYRVHGVSNNATACVWCGLLAYGDDGMVLTDLGRTMLADWKASPEGQAWLAEWADPDEPTAGPEPTPEVPGDEPARPSRPSQLDLFAS
ncbi:hypothetical protein [Streptomyces qinglanensis]|uniref:hypothetical protein n=1 Tax=Streptomyces qinglanensis TaxID=943816 RepID=UPI003D74529C